MEGRREANPSAVPVVPKEEVQQTSHRQHKESATAPEFGETYYPAGVASKVPRGRWSDPKIRAALDKEWNKLANQVWPDTRGSGCWDVSKVREAADVRKEARDKGIKMHFGRVAELLYEKGGELPPGHPDRKFKGRCVWLGDQMRDEHHNYAVFDEMGMVPAAIEARSAVDALSLFKY